MKILSLLTGILCFALPVMAEYWQNDVHYRIDVSVDDAQKTFDCSQKLTFTNNSPDTLSVLYFRIAANSLKPEVLFIERNFFTVGTAIPMPIRQNWVTVVFPISVIRREIPLITQPIIPS